MKRSAADTDADQSLQGGSSGHFNTHSPPLSQNPHFNLTHVDEPAIPALPTDSWLLVYVVPFPIASLLAQEVARFR